MSTLTQALNQSMPNQWAPSAINVYRDTSMQLSMPNRWAWSAINVYTDTSTKLINSRKIGKISYQCLLRHKHLIDQCQTNRHHQLSMSTGTQACNYQCQTDGHDQLSMSTQTQALNWSMLNQWAQSSTHSFRTRTWLLLNSNQSRVSLSTEYNSRC